MSGVGVCCRARVISQGRWPSPRSPMQPTTQPWAATHLYHLRNRIGQHRQNRPSPRKRLQQWDLNSSQRVELSEAAAVGSVWRSTYHT